MKDAKKDVIIRPVEHESVIYIGEFIMTGALVTTWNMRLSFTSETQV